MYPVRICPGRRATVSEFTPPPQSCENHFAEVVPGIYLTDIVVNVYNERYAVPDGLYAYGELYYCDNGETPVKTKYAHVIAVPDTDVPKVVTEDDIPKCAVHDSHKYASAVIMPSGQFVVIHCAVPDGENVVGWEYSPREHMLEIIGDGPIPTGPVATVTACRKIPDEGICYRSIYVYPRSVFFGMWADNHNIYISFVDTLIYQIRLE